MTFKGGIKYNDVFKVFLMPPRVKEKGGTREFSSNEQRFLCNLEIPGGKYSNICTLFTDKFGKSPPSRAGIKKMVTKLRNKF